jgi:hypothetical protein
LHVEPQRFHEVRARLQARVRQRHQNKRRARAPERAASHALPQKRQQHQREELHTARSGERGSGERGPPFSASPDGRYEEKHAGRLRVTLTGGFQHRERLPSVQHQVTRRHHAGKQKDRCDLKKCKYTLDYVI